jgi:hypothetical protein
MSKSVRFLHIFCLCDFGNLPASRCLVWCEQLLLPTLAILTSSFATLRPHLTHPHCTCPPTHSNNATDPHHIPVTPMYTLYAVKVTGSGDMGHPWPNSYYKHRYISNIMELYSFHTSAYITQECVAERKTSYLLVITYQLLIRIRTTKYSTI